MGANASTASNGENAEEQARSSSGPTDYYERELQQG